jgi:hypothetical protein
MSKGYTIQSFINLFTNTTNSTLNRVGVETVVSPRFGVYSVKFNTLEDLLNTDVYDVVNGIGTFATLGKTPRTRILTALRNRKKFGTVLP